MAELHEENKWLVTQIFDHLNYEDDFVGVLGIIADIREWVDAILQALGGNFGPLVSLVGELLSNPIPDWEWISDLSNWNPIGDMISLLQTMLNQMIDIVRGLVITPINTMVQHFKDWFLGLIGWQTNTTNKHQELTNMVWAGATTQVVQEDLTEAQVRDAVAALKARSEALQQENELRYQQAVPLWQGLIPGGDVTCDINNVNVRDNWYINVTGTSGTSSLHSHGAGSYQVNLALSNGHAITSHLGTIYTGPMAVFRARSGSERNVISFLARSVGSVSDGRCTLWTYDYENDRWMCVARSENFMPQVGAADYGWVDVVLEESYTPSVGELMGVLWTTTGTGNVLIATSFSGSDTAGNWRIPSYHSVPYGNNIVFGQDGMPDLGRTVELKTPSDWRIGKTPFAQIAPNLGQTYNPPPQYWFDDFNTNDSAPYKLSSKAKISGGKLQYGGGGLDATYEWLVYKGQMSTDHMAVEATLSSVDSAPSYMRIHCTSNGTGGLGVMFSSTSKRLAVYRMSETDWENGSTLAEVEDIIPTAGPARWRLEFNDNDKTYYLKRNGVVIYSYPDPYNTMQRGKGKRSGGLGVSRIALFGNSGTWDDLLIYDMDETVS